MEKIFNATSKEAIRSRILKNAVKIWGLTSTNSLDPFVRLLIDAFSTEFFKTNNEIQLMNVRVMEKLSKILTPSMYTYPQPAHAIATVAPSESIELLSDKTEFSLQKKFSSIYKFSDNELSISLTPVGKVELTKLNTNLIIVDKTCSIIDEAFHKIPIAKIEEELLPKNTIILGIDASNYEEERLPEKLNLYCANQEFEHLDFLFKLLPFIKVRNHDTELTVRKGMTYQREKSLSGYEEIFKDQSIETKIVDNIKNIYNEKFIEISGIRNAVIDNDYPQYLEPLFNNLKVENNIIGKKFIWLTLEFPFQYTEPILEGFIFLLNTFPVYNRRWKNNGNSLDIMKGNIPLLTEKGEYFLSVNEVSDEYNNIYNEIPFSESSELNMNLYTLRKGGMERFSERDALESISNLLELIRDEVAAFGIFDKDKVTDSLRGMTNEMRLLEQRIRNSDNDIIQKVNYIIVNMKDNTNNINVDYWITNCELANNIRVGTSFEMEKRSGTEASRSLILISETIGGEKEQKGTNAVEAYKYALTTRDRLITAEDIKSFCTLMFKDSLKSVDIRRITTVSKKPKEGFIRAIEVTVIINNYDKLGSKYWENQTLILKEEITLRSIDGLEYIINIKNADHDK